MLPIAILKQVGPVTITIEALSQLGRDMQEIILNVEPEGALVRYHTSVLLDLKNRARVYEFMDLPVDESPEITRSILRRYVYGSPNAKVAITGDVFGPIAHDMTVSFSKAFNGRYLQSCDGFAFNFGSTLWSLHYLRLTNQLRVSKAKKAFEYLNVQLVNLLARYKEGGFSMWFLSKSSVWMTSWVLNLLLAAQLEDWENLIYIEPKLINHAVAFILEHQRDDGSFWEPASNVTHDFKMSFKESYWESEETRRDPTMTALTALVTTVLYSAGPTLDGSLQAEAAIARLKAIRFLERQLDRLWDSYDVAITTYALVVVGSPLKEVAIKILASHAKISGKLMHWSRTPISSNVRHRENNQKMFLLPKEPQEWDSYAIEATSYALLVFLTHEGVTSRAESITEWLISVKNWDFAYSSTLVSIMQDKFQTYYIFFLKHIAFLETKYMLPFISLNHN
ncbi:hypothetical protein SK128_010000 [Halocaridina rubra]|uniref:Alpha-macroglobulin-like TED domain-containing protein n=1 Tax=Halocaridina rubra TaxID=373956 RepID=A0AAN9ACV4_HALRR